MKDKRPYDEGWTLLASGKKGQLRRSEGRAVGWEQRWVSAPGGGSVGGCGLAGLRLQE